MANDTVTMARFNRVTTIHPQNRNPVPSSGGSSASSSISGAAFAMIESISRQPN
jgi:hypothetical protein